MLNVSALMISDRLFALWTSVFGGFPSSQTFFFSIDTLLTTSPHRGAKHETLTVWNTTESTSWADSSKERYYKCHQVSFSWQVIADFRVDRRLTWWTHHFLWIMTQIIVVHQLKGFRFWFATHRGEIDKALVNREIFKLRLNFYLKKRKISSY